MGGRPCLAPTCCLVPLHGIFLALIPRLAFLLIAPDACSRATSCGGWAGALFSVPARQGKVPCELVIQWRGTLILHRMHTHDGLGGEEARREKLLFDQPLLFPCIIPTESILGDRW